MHCFFSCFNLHRMDSLTVPNNLRPRNLRSRQIRLKSVSKLGILKPLKIELIIKSISVDRVTPQLSKNMLIVKSICFIVEIFALKVNVLREISTKKEKIWDFDGSQSKFDDISSKRYKLQQWIFPKPCTQKIWNKSSQIENIQYFWEMFL